MEESLLTISQVAKQTGLSEPTLRAWERRFGYPKPVRGPGGRRRYPSEQVDQLWQIKNSRKAGLSLEAAVARAAQAPPAVPTTIFASLAQRRGARPLPIAKRALTLVVRGLEDEMLASGARPLVFASFQRERFFTQSEHRYREIARSAELVLVRADFPSVRESGRLVEVPLDPEQPASREWVFGCYAPGFAVGLAAWELVDEHAGSDEHRRFELVWTADAAAVRQAARTAVDLAAGEAPDLAGRAEPLLEAEPPPEGEEHRRLTAMANRVLSYLVEPSVHGDRS